METFLLILAAILFLLSAFLLQRMYQVMSEIRQMKDEVSQLKNMGDLMSVTESTLDETNKTIESAKRIMDKRIRRMEELLRAMESKTSGNHTDRQYADGSRSSSVDDHIKTPITRQSGSPGREVIDSDVEEREYIARRNRQIILMLEEGVSEAEIARRTQASMHEIKLIKKFIQ